MACRTTAGLSGRSHGSSGPLAFRQCVHARLHQVPVIWIQRFPSPTKGAIGAPAVSAGTTYIASYYAPSGHYAGDGGYFATTGWTNGPLSAPASVAGAGNGVYRYGSTSGFPNDTWGSANYWVDVVFARDTTAPSITTRNPGPGSTGVPPSSNVTATWSKVMNAASRV